MVTIRERKLKNGKISLLLDIYIHGLREVRSLNIYLDANANTPLKKAQNKEKRLKAETICKKKELEIIENDYSLVSTKQSNIRFLDYFKSLKEKKRGSLGNYGNWDSTYKILVEYFNSKDVRLNDLTDKDLNDIRTYFLSVYRTKSNKILSQNAASSYFNKVRISLNQAFEEGILKKNIVKPVKSIKPGDTAREYLIKEEIDKLIKTDCETPVIKNAFLFGVYSGLRFSDIIKLKWGDLKFTDASGYSIKYQQQKTKSHEMLPIPKIALQYLGDVKDADEKVFKGLKYSAWTNLKLAQWVMKAGIIDKHITFHSARHTYATYMLTKGVAIPTVSKMLGHKDIKTTMIYTKIIDAMKINAASVFDEE